jgi:hypothetical protein
MYMKQINCFLFLSVEKYSYVVVNFVNECVKMNVMMNSIRNMTYVIHELDTDTLKSY